MLRFRMCVLSPCFSPALEKVEYLRWLNYHRCANLPHVLSTAPANVHLHLIAACEYFEEDRDAGRLRRRVRGPKSLIPHMSIIADDLLGAYKGTHVSTFL
jgi:hypothetical protein